MKRWFLGLFTVIAINPVFAFDLAPTMYLEEHLASYTSSFDVSTEDRKLGTLYRRVLSLNTVYDFYDTKNTLLASAHSHFLSLGAHLDVFDNHQILLGTVEEKVFSWFPTFEIYSPDGIRLANATMNFWGTTFTVYDGRSSRVLLEMSRDFFRLRNYWTIHIKDLDRVREKQIDSRLLLTVLAIQGDIEYLEHYLNRNRENRNNNHLSLSLQSLPNSLKQYEKEHNKFSDFLRQEEELQSTMLPEPAQLNQLAQQLDHAFLEQYPGMPLDPSVQAEEFVYYCNNIIQAADTNPETKKGILHLLNKRFAEKTGK